MASQNKYLRQGKLKSASCFRESVIQSAVAQATANIMRQVQKMLFKAMKPEMI